MKLQKILILFVLLVSIALVWQINKWLQKIIQPRRSMAQLVLYILVSLIFVFAYTFGLIVVISYLFPQNKG